MDPRRWHVTTSVSWITPGRLAAGTHPRTDVANHKKHRKRPTKYPKFMPLSWSCVKRLGNTRERFRASTRRQLAAGAAQLGEAYDAPAR